MSRLNERRLQADTAALTERVKELEDQLKEINNTDFVQQYEITKKALAELQEVHSKQEADFQALQQKYEALQGTDAKAKGKIIDGKYYTAAQLSSAQ